MNTTQMETNKNGKNRLITPVPEGISTQDSLQTSPKEELPVCEITETAEHSRLDDPIEPCDDGRAGGR